MVGQAHEEGFMEAELKRVDAAGLPIHARGGWIARTTPNDGLADRSCRVTVSLFEAPRVAKRS